MSKPIHQRRGHTGAPGTRPPPAPPNPSRPTLPSGLQGPINPGGRLGYLKPQKKEAADVRMTVRNNRTPKEQLDLLDKRLGKNVGATKERMRLHKMIANGFGGDKIAAK